LWSEDLVQFVGQKFVHTFLNLGSTFSAASLLSALCIAIAFTLLKRPTRTRDVSLRVMRRAVFPRWLYRHVSFKVDIFFLLFNVFIFGLLFGWALLSMQFFSRTTSDALAGFFGLEQQNTSASLTTKALITLALFFAYELGYWTYHYLSHKIPFLWEFQSR